MELTLDRQLKGLPGWRTTERVRGKELVTEQRESGP